jgi:hypothetical protein
MFHNQKVGVAMASPFAPLVVSYSVEDFEKQIASTMPQNQHFLKMMWIMSISH